MVYVITEEQIQSEHGLFSVQRNYVELYRVIDYREDQSFIQMVFGIKTITIYSGDRSNPQLKLIGIKNDMDLISIIRQRVEYNKNGVIYMSSRITNKIREWRIILHPFFRIDRISVNG